VACDETKYFLKMFALFTSGIVIFSSGFQRNASQKLLNLFRLNLVLDHYTEIYGANFIFFRIGAMEPLIYFIELTKSMNRVLAEKLLASQLVNKFPVFFEIRNVISVFIRALHQSLIPIQIGLIHKLLKSHFKEMGSATFRFPI
jgi:hypothetical protein